MAPSAGASRALRLAPAAPPRRGGRVSARGASLLVALCASLVSARTPSVEHDAARLRSEQCLRETAAAPCGSCFDGNSCGWSHVWCEQELCAAHAGCTALGAAQVPAAAARIGGLDVPDTQDLIAEPPARPRARSEASAAQTPAREVVLIAGAARDGFWAMVLSVLNAALFARQTGRDFLVWRNDTRDPFCGRSVARTPGESCWEQLFEPIGVRAAAPAPSVVAPRLLAPATGGRLVGLSCEARHALWTNLTRIYPSSPAIAAAERARRGAVVERWARPTGRIRAAVRAWWVTHVQPLTDAGRPIRVLGVHVRGTDKWIQGVVDVHCYYPLIDAYLAAFGLNTDVRILVATDDARFDAAIVARYGRTRVLRQGDGVLRGDAGTPVWQQRYAVGEADARSTQRAEQVLLDTLLLANCHFLLKSASAVPEFALYYNPQLPSFDLQIPGERLPAWAEAAARAGRAEGQQARSSGLARASAVTRGAGIRSGNRRARSYKCPASAPKPQRASRLSTLNTWMPPTCPGGARGEDSLNETRAIFLTGRQFGLFANHLRSITNALSYAYALNSTLHLDRPLSLFIVSYFDMAWLRRFVSQRRLVLDPGVTKPLEQRSARARASRTPAPAWRNSNATGGAFIRLEQGDSFWCGGPCTRAHPHSQFGLSREMMFGLRRGGQSGNETGGDDGYPSRETCAYWPFRPHMVFFDAVKPVIAAEPRWTSRVIGYHQRSQTVVPHEAVGVNCRASAQRIVDVLIDGRNPGSSGEADYQSHAALEANARLFYLTVCAAAARPEMLLNVRSDTERDEAFLFLASDKYARSARRGWIEHMRVFEGAVTMAKLPKNADPYNANLGKWLSYVYTHFRQRRYLILQPNKQQTSLAPHTARMGDDGGDEEDILDEPAPDVQVAYTNVDVMKLDVLQNLRIAGANAGRAELSDMLQLVAADEFWPTPGSTFSEAVCYWQVTWGGKQLPPFLRSCRDITSGWGPACETPADIGLRKLKC